MEKEEEEEYQLKLVLAWKQGKNERFMMKKRSEDRTDLGFFETCQNKLLKR